MKPLHTPTPPSPTAPRSIPGTLAWTHQTLPPQHPVQVLDGRAGQIVLLEVEQGRVWVTCDGGLEDYFLEAGQRLSFAGPVRLRLSAEGGGAARLCWAQHRAVKGAAYPPTPVHSAPTAENKPEPVQRTRAAGTISAA